MCGFCNDRFEIFAHIGQYDKLVTKKKIICPHCKSNQVTRDYTVDCSNISGCVKKGDSELKTIGDLANRNSDRMSDDHKRDLYIKHNSYKEEPSPKELPKGMSRIKKPPKPKWR